MRRRDFIRKSFGAVAVGVGSGLPVVVPATALAGRGEAASSRASVILHNGISLPDPFPPVATDFLDTTVQPYYIDVPPDPILIDVGRQLFVDDFLVEDVIGLRRSFNRPVVHPDPLVSPRDDEFSVYLRPSGVNTTTYFAAPFSDGVWWDRYAGVFRAWLLSGRTAVRLVESDDGFVWFPRPGGDENESVISIPPARDSGTVWIDFETDDESARYKMGHFNFTDRRNWLYTSADGVKWPGFTLPAAKTDYYSSNPDAPTGDRTTFFRDPFRKKWIWSLRDIMDLRPDGGREFNRVRKFAETDDLIGDPAATSRNSNWLLADRYDIAAAGGGPGAAQLYNLDGIAYESIMLFFVSIWSGPEVLDHGAQEALPKKNSVHLGFSRDGYNVVRTPEDQRAPFIEADEPGSFMEGNVQSVGGGVVITGSREQEELLIYFSGRENRLAGLELERRGHMGVARLRRDGFASFEPSEGEEEGVLLTRVLRFGKPGGLLFVNADATDGELIVEVTDRTGAPVGGLSASECRPMQVDSTPAPDCLVRLVES